jgi:hypothetical protein
MLVDIAKIAITMPAGLIWAWNWRRPKSPAPRCPNHPKYYTKLYDFFYTFFINVLFDQTGSGVAGQRLNHKNNINSICYKLFRLKFCIWHKD